MNTKYDVKKIVLRIQYDEISKIVTDIGKEMPYAIVKGAPLSLHAYNDYCSRKVGDVDFLVSRKNISKLTNILKANGFKMQYRNREDEIVALMYSHQTRPFVKNTSIRKMYVDVNYDIFWGEYAGKRIDIDKFLGDAVEMEIEHCRIKTLNPLKAMVHLVLHHYKEMNSLYHLSVHKSITREMFMDIYNLIKNNQSEISVNNLYNISREYEIIDYVFYMLFYTYDLFGDDILKEYIERFRTNEGVKLLSCYGLCESERKEWKYDFQTRIASKDLFGLIKNELTYDDWQKIERSIFIFGD